MQTDPYQGQTRESFHSLTSETLLTRYGALKASRSNFSTMSSFNLREKLSQEIDSCHSAAVITIVSSSNSERR
jgi:hypothetical protein